MFGSLALEIAVGLFLFFLLFSLICTALQEMVTSLCGLRFRSLEKGLLALLEDEKLAQRVLASPAIERLMHPHVREARRQLAAGTSRPTPLSRLRRFFSKGRGPSYIPSNVFVAALLEALLKAEAEDRKPETGAQGRADDKSLPACQLFEDARDLIGKIPKSSPMRQSLLLALNRTSNDLEAVQNELSTWFDQTMDRVSGWYRRQIKLITLCIAAVLAIGLNANAIQIAIALAENQALRISVLRTAGGVFDVMEPQGAARSAGGATDSVTFTLPAVLSPSSREGADFIESGVAQFPVGWGDECAFAMVGAADPAADCGPWWVNLIEAIGGWLATIAAASLGAPFWFNLLDKLVRIRGSGNPAPTSQRT